MCLEDMLCSTNALLISHVDYLCHTEIICDMQFYWFIQNETISETEFCVFGHRVISVLKGYVLHWICGALLNNLSLMLQYLFTTATTYRWPKIMYMILCQNVSLLSHVMPWITTVESRSIVFEGDGENKQWMRKNDQSKYVVLSSSKVS